MNQFLLKDQKYTAVECKHRLCAVMQGDVCLLAGDPLLMTDGRKWNAVTKDSVGGDGLCVVYSQLWAVLLMIKYLSMLRWPINCSIMALLTYSKCYHLTLFQMLDCQLCWISLCVVRSLVPSSYIRLWARSGKLELYCVIHTVVYHSPR